MRAGFRHLYGVGCRVQVQRCRVQGVGFGYKEEKRKVQGVLSGFVEHSHMSAEVVRGLARAGEERRTHQRGRMWHMQDSQCQILALLCGSKSSKLCT